MMTSKWFTVCAVLLSSACAFVAATAADDSDLSQLTGSSVNVHGLRAPSVILPSTVTETVALYSTTIIKTVISTVSETVVVNAITETTTIINVPQTINLRALTTTVFKEAACTIRVAQEPPLSESYGEAIVSETNPSGNEEPNDGVVQTISLDTLRNEFDRLSGSSVKNESVVSPTLVNSTIKHSDGVAVDNKVVRVYPRNKFTSVMAALSQLVAEMKMRDSRPDLVKRYEEVVNIDAIAYRSPVSRMEELEKLAEEVLDLSRNGGHESDIFFERMEKFVGFMETIYL